MFLSKQTKGGIVYLYLIESSYDRETHTRRKKIVKSFGQYEVFAKEHPDELKTLEEEYGDQKKKAQQVREKSITDFFHKGEQGTNIAAEINCLFPQKTAHLLLHKIWDDELLMSRHLSYLKSLDSNPVKFNVSNLALYFSTLKIVNPCSYFKGLELSPRFLGDPMSEVSSDDVYRCLGYLSAHKEQLFKHINTRLDTLTDRKHSLIFYDCTNCYFESPYNDSYWYRKKALRLIRKQLRDLNAGYAALSDRELNQVIENTPDYSVQVDELLEAMGEPFRMHGVSKEKRTDLPLVSIALIIDENAIPIDFEVYAGNKSEKKTMVKSIRALKEKYQVNNAMVVADSGLNSATNLLMLNDENLGFSVAKSALSFEKKIREKELDLSTFKNMVTDEGEVTPYRYKIIDFKTRKAEFTDSKNLVQKKSLDCKLLITFSEKRKERDIANLEAMLVQAQDAVQQNKEITHKFSGWKQFVETNTVEAEEANTSENDDGKGNKSKRTKKLIAVKLNEKLIEKRRKCAGFAGVLFKEAPTEKTEYQPSFISSMYHKLVKIEECFRIMKKDFEIRPMYLREQNHIKGHVFLCITALIMLRLLQRKFAENNLPLSVEKIKDLLQNEHLTMAYRGELEPLLFKSQELPINNCLRVKDEETEKRMHDFLSGNKLLYVLGLPRIKNVTTMDELRKVFKIKTLELSDFQKEYMKKLRAE